MFLIPLILFNVQYSIKLSNYFYLSKSQQKLIYLNIVALVLGLIGFGLIALYSKENLKYYALMSSLTSLILTIICEVVIKNNRNYLFRSIIFYIGVFLSSVLSLVTDAWVLYLIPLVIFIVVYFNPLLQIFNKDRRKINESSND